MFITISQGGNSLYLTLKRIIDFTGAGLSLIALSPILAILGITIWIQMGSPILFRQMRPGLNGQPFSIYKFRSMTGEYNENGELLPDKERLTRLGRFLRNTSLDELPELLNVLKGHMSLVGPRPLVVWYMDRYTDEQARRCEMKPGITGWAQVNGRNAISWEEKFALDVWYIDNWSLWLDVKILAVTFWKVLSREGVNASEEISMPEFMGTQANKEAALTTDDKK